MAPSKWKQKQISFRCGNYVDNIRCATHDECKQAK